MSLQYKISYNIFTYIYLCIVYNYKLETICEFGHTSIT